MSSVRSGDLMMFDTKARSIRLVAMLAAFAMFAFAGCTSPVNAKAREAPPSDVTASAQKLPSIVLKLDDVGFGHELSPGWAEVMDYLDQEGVVGTIGLIGKGLERPHPELVAWLKDRAADGHEMWNHGYCHCRPPNAQPEHGLNGAEFRGTSYNDQLQSLLRTQALARKHLGLTLVTFGAPYNATDAQTVAAIAAIPELKIWMFKETATPTDRLVLKRVRSVNIEYPVHQPDFKQFKNGFEAHLDADILVIQGHPRSWVDEPQRFEEFKKIIAYLKARGVKFTTPSEYAGML